MKKIKIPDLTIKRMLIGLLIIGVLGISAPMLTSLYSNKELISSQKRLTDIAIPLDNATQSVKIAAMTFAIRRYSISESKSMEELAGFVKREPLEQRYSEGIQYLKKLSQKARVTDAAKKIQRLETLYEEILKKDALILESVRNRLRLETEIRNRTSTLDSVEENLYENSAAFIEKISEAVHKHIAQSSDGTKDSEKGKELSNIHKAASDLRLAIAFSTNYGRQILTVEEQEKAALIKSRIIGAAGLAETALASLKSGESGVAELNEILQHINGDYNLLKKILSDDKDSIVTLRLQWLEEQKNMTSLNDALNQITGPLMKSLDEIQLLADRVRSEAEEEASIVSKTASTFIMIASLVAILCMVPTGLWIMRRIILPVNKLVAFADVISEGDLTVEIQKEYNDEVGNLVSKLSDMARNLNSLIGQVQRSGIQVTSSATELSATSKQQEAVMKTQLESTNYVVRSIGEISSVSEDLVETMQKVAAMSEQTAEFASTGQADLAHMEEAMGHMENASKSISGKLEAINEKAANITSVVTTITKVADQTNLLSLNAAIEAEKAGEYGRGFTVVAREIRRLADQTAVATLDIEQMVQEMQSAVSAGVMEMDAFITEVQRSAENVGKISIQLSRIIEQVQALSPSFEGVNESMQFQAQNAQKINSSMTNLSEEMQQTVESLRESFLAIEQLNDASRGLQNEVSRFKVI